MTKRGYTREYCSIRVLKYHQRTIELMSSIGFILEEPLRQNDRSTCIKSIENELEVMDKSLPDYSFLTRALQDLKDMETE